MTSGTPGEDSVQIRLVTGSDLVEGLPLALSLGVDLAYLTLPDGELLQASTRSLPRAASDWQRREAILRALLTNDRPVRVLVHASDESLGSVLAIAAGLERRPTAVIAWARLYSPGNKPSEWVDPGTDWLLEFDPSRTVASSIEFLGADVAGRAEQGRRELIRVFDDPPSDLIARPAALANWVLERWQPSCLLEAPIEAAGLSARAAVRGIPCVGINVRDDIPCVRIVEERVGRVRFVEPGAASNKPVRLPPPKTIPVPRLDVREASFTEVELDQADVVLGERLAWVSPAAIPGVASALASNDAVAVVGPSLLGADDQMSTALSVIASAFGRIVLVGSALDVLVARGVLATASASEYRGMVIEEPDARRGAAFYRAPGASRRTVFYREAVERPRGNPDEDPRGAYFVRGHKGARSVGRPFGYTAPPYRWRLVKGTLPPGVWRVNETSGAIFAKELMEAGTFSFTAEVEDADGCTARSVITITVGTEAEGTTTVKTWLSDPPKSGGRLRITSTELPSGRRGAEYGFVLLATGGHPYGAEAFYPADGRRGWEYSLSTLEKHIAFDRAIYPKPRGTRASPPSIKDWGGSEVAARQPAVLGRVSTSSSDAHFLEVVGNFIHPSRLVLIGPEFRPEVQHGVALSQVSRAEEHRDRAITQLTRDGYVTTPSPWPGSEPVIAWGRSDAGLGVVMSPAVVAGRAVSDSIVASAAKSDVVYPSGGRLTIYSFATGPDARGIRLVTEG